MSFYTCFDWYKKLRLFVYVLNLKIDVVLKASRAVVIRWFSLNEAPFVMIHYQTWPSTILVSDWPIKKNLLLWNCLAKLTETWTVLYEDCSFRLDRYIFQYHNKLEAQWAEPVSLTFHSALRKLNTQPSIHVHVDASYQVSVHLARQFQRRFIQITSTFYTNQNTYKMTCDSKINL
jgi:hypothetical protein